MKMFLRALADILVLLITLPIRILYVLYLCIYIVITAKKFGDPISEWFGYVLKGLQTGIKTEIHWIKTGEFRKL